MSYVAFSSRIKTTMETLGSLKKVYDYEPKNPEGFPFCSILPVDGGDTAKDSCDNETVYTFRVQILDDMASEQVTREEIETRMREVADSTLLLFREKNLFLPEGGLFHIVKNNSFKYVEREGGYSRVFEVLIEIKEFNELT